MKIRHSRARSSRWSLAVAVAAPGRAPPNKEHQQLMADLRMLQEQTQQLQNLTRRRR